MCDCATFEDGSMHLCAEHVRAHGAALLRLLRIEAAARDLIGYEAAGEPLHTEWDAKFDALKEALDG